MLIDVRGATEGIAHVDLGRPWHCGRGRFLLSTAQELTKRAARYRDMSQELIVIVSIIAAATFSLGLFTGYALRAMISRRRRRYSRR
jgi:voltage-gated potassium channel Kch